MIPISTRRLVVATSLSLVLGASHARAQTPPAPQIAKVLTSSDATIHYRTVKVQGLDIFYREAGDPRKPTLLLLHGFPTSSRMFRNLIPRLADRYHVVAPDYPGFGRSSAPTTDQFIYSFANFANVVDELATKIGLKNYVLYVQDYGAPVGYRLALKHPERVKGLIVQNGNAYEEGLREFWRPIRKLWDEPSQANREALMPSFTLEATKWQYTHGVSDPMRLDPGAWQQDTADLARPGNSDIQLALFYDYRTNVSLYPQFQAFFRTQQPPTLVIWGKNDFIFPVEGAEPYKRDLKNLEFHLIDSGHFLLEDKGLEAAALIRSFLDRKVR